MVWADIPAANIARCRELLSLEGCNGPEYKCVRSQAERIRVTFQMNDKHGRSDPSGDDNMPAEVDLAQWKMRKTRAETLVAEEKLAAKRQALLKRFLDEVVHDAVTSHFQPLAQMAAKSLAPTDRRKWNAMVDKCGHEFSEAMPGKIDEWIRKVDEE